MPALLVLFTLTAASSWDAGAPRASQAEICREIADRQCRFEERCGPAGDPHHGVPRPVGPGAHARCVEQNAQTICGGVDGGAPANLPEGMEFCLRQLYPDTGCHQELNCLVALQPSRPKTVEGHPTPQRFDLDAGGAPQLDAGSAPEPDAGLPRYVPVNDPIKAAFAPLDGGADEPPDEPHPFFTPVQASVDGLAQLGAEGSTLGIAFYLGAALGQARVAHQLSDHEGLFYGAGMSGALTTTDLAGCGRSSRCANRTTIGPTLRIGYAIWNRVKLVDRLAHTPGEPAGTIVWPDQYAYFQVSGVFGAETLPSAPLSPEQRAGLLGVRVGLGITSVELGRTAFYLIAESIKSMDAQTAAIGLVLLPLALLEHLELTLEWTHQALSEAGWRAGLLIGTGF